MLQAKCTYDYIDDNERDGGEYGQKLVPDKCLKKHCYTGIQGQIREYFYKKSKKVDFQFVVVETVKSLKQYTCNNERKHDYGIKDK